MTFKNLKGDITGGVVSAVVALPQALAFGVATGFGASSGLFGAIVLCFFAGIFGGKTPLISGPTGPAAIIAASVVAALNNDFGAVFLVLLLSALIQIGISFTSFSSIVKYIPYPVISGFMNGVGFILILMQINPLIGHKIESSTVLSVQNFILNLGSINFHALFLGVLTLLILFFTPKKISAFLPPSLIALIVCTFISTEFNFTLDRISMASSEILSFVSFNFSHELIGKCLPMALVLAVVCTSESMLTGLVCDSLTKEKTDRKKIIFSQGVGNLFCALTGSLVGSAATMRTVAAINSGASTRLASIASSVVLLSAMFFFSGFVEKIPLAVLAGILIKTGFDIIDVKLLKVLKYAPKDDLYVLSVVFLLTVFYNLIFAVGAGITLAALLYAKRVADKTSLIDKTHEISLQELKLEKEIEKELRHKIRVVHIDGQFFFGSATRIVSQFDEILGVKYLILNYESESLLDISAVFALEDIIIRLKSQHIKLLLVINSDKVLSQLEDLNIVAQIGQRHIFETELDAIHYAKEHVKRNREK